MCKPSDNPPPFPSSNKTAIAPTISSWGTLVLGALLGYLFAVVLHGLGQGKADHEPTATSIQELEEEGIVQ